MIAPTTISRGGMSAIGAQHPGQRELVVVAAVDSVEAAAEVEEVATEADSVAEEVIEAVSEEAEVDQTEGIFIALKHQRILLIAMPCSTVRHISSLLLHSLTIVVPFYRGRDDRRDRPY